MVARVPLPVVRHGSGAPTTKLTHYPRRWGLANAGDGAICWATMLKYEAIIRLGCFLGIFAVMAAWEGIASRRERSVPRWRRWPNNLSVAILDTVVTRIVAPTGAVGFALLAEAKGWGLFAALTWPAALE